MVVVCLGGVVDGLAVPISSEFLHQRKADSSVIAAMTAVTTARNRAVAERRNMELTFVGTNRIQISRVEVPDGDLTPVQDFTLENGLRFIKFDQVPDTPD